MFNVFNRQDQALKMDVNGLWWRGQVHEKPLASRPTLFWADLHYLNDIDKAVWRADALLDIRPLDVDVPLDQITKAVIYEEESEETVLTGVALELADGRRKIIHTRSNIDRHIKARLLAQINDALSRAKQ